MISNQCGEHDTKYMDGYTYKKKLNQNCITTQLKVQHTVFDLSQYLL